MITYQMKSIWVEEYVLPTTTYLSQIAKKYVQIIM